MAEDVEARLRELLPAPGFGKWVIDHDRIRGRVAVQFEIAYATGFEVGADALSDPGIGRLVAKHAERCMELWIESMDKLVSDVKRSRDGAD